MNSATAPRLLTVALLALAACAQGDSNVPSNGSDDQGSLPGNSAARAPAESPSVNDWNGAPEDSDGAAGPGAIEHPAGCPITSSRDWQAWVNEMPGPNSNPRLIVTGNVTVPTGGYRVRLKLGPLQEIEPPFQMIYLIAEPPQGPATQAIETLSVRQEFAGRESYSGVSIVCGGRLIGEVKPVSTVQ